MTDPHAVRTPATAPDLTVVEFLRDRLDEEAQRAEALMARSPHRWRRVTDVGGWLNYAANHIARHDPARVLRDVAAKRKIVDRLAGVHLSYSVAGTTQADLAVARLLAEVYDQHPDYHERWRP